MAILSASPAPTPPRRRSVSQASGRDPSLPAVDRPRSTSCGRQVPTPRSQSLQRSLGGRGETRSEARKKEPPRVEGLPAVLFLDVDGVLHPVQARHPRQQFATGCLALVADVVKATGASICLSTAWRLDPSARRFVEEKLREFGLGPPIGRTPNLAQFHRSREILASQSSNQVLGWPWMIGPLTRKIRRCMATLYSLGPVSGFSRIQLSVWWNSSKRNSNA
eukprot:s1879_g9.t1